MKEAGVLIKQQKKFIYVQGRIDADVQLSPSRVMRAGAVAKF